MLCALPLPPSSPPPLPFAIIHLFNSCFCFRLTVDYYTDMCWSAACVYCAWRKIDMRVFYSVRFGTDWFAGRFKRCRILYVFAMSRFLFSLLSYYAHFAIVILIEILYKTYTTCSVSCGWFCCYDNVHHMNPFVQGSGRGKRGGTRKKHDFLLFRAIEKKVIWKRQ